MKDDITKFLRLKAKKDSLKAELKEVEQGIENVTELIIMKMNNQGLSSMKLDTGENLRINVRQYYSIKGETKTELVNRIIDADYLDILTVKPQLAKKFIEENRLTPEKYINEYEKATLSLRKS